MFEVTVLTVTVLTSSVKGTSTFKLLMNSLKDQSENCHKICLLLR